MTLPNIVVVGGDIAGTAAAMTARLSGASVALMHAHGGASALSSGALDLLPWGTSNEGEPLEDWDRLVLRELGLYTLPSRGALVATCAGVLRPALGHDDAIADIASWRTGTTLVPTFPAQGWNGRLLARSLQDSSMGHDLSMHFATTSVALNHVPPSLIMTGAAPAIWHDETSHLRALGEVLRKVVDVCEVRPVGILLPPWLGVARPRAQQLSSHLGIPCGEVLSEPGQAAGFRFESARDRALERLEVKVFEEAVQFLEPTGEGWKVIGGAGTTLECQGVLLALGGLLGGGLTFRPPSEGRLSLGPRVNLNTPFGLPLGLGVDGTPLRDCSSLHGLPGHTWLRPANGAASLERLGIQCNPDGFPLSLMDEGGASGPVPRALRAAGECVEGVPSTWLASMRSGIRAGRSLCGELV